MITWWPSAALRRSHRDHIARAHARDEELIGRVWDERATWMERAHVALGTARATWMERARIWDERATWMERAHAALGTARVPDCHVGSGAAEELHHD